MQKGEGFCDLASSGEGEANEVGNDGALEEEVEEDGPSTALRAPLLASLSSSASLVTCGGGGRGDRRLVPWWRGGRVPTMADVCRMDEKRGTSRIPRSRRDL